MQLITDSTQTPEADAVFLTVLTGLPLVMFPFWTLIFLQKNKDKLNEKEFKKKYSGLYDDLKQNFKVYSSQVLLFPTLFLLRRASYVLLAMVEM